MTIGAPAAGAGSPAGRARRRWWPGAPPLFGVALAALLALTLGLAWVVPLPARLSLQASSVVRWRDGRTAFLTLSEDDRWRVPVDVDDVDPAYVEALIRLEDRRFWWHPGVDPLAVGRAAVGNLARGRVVSGASTITMQVVRLCEPRPRTLRSKLVEAARAVQLELRLSKADILSAYLDLVPMGGNLEGVEAASQAFFGHGAGSLDAAEIAVLLAIPQDPNHRAPAPEHVSTLTAARDAIAARLLAEGLLEAHLADPEDAAEDAAEDASEAPARHISPTVRAEDVLARIRATPVPRQRRPMPRHAAHAAAWLLGGPAVSGRDLRTTLDAGVQARVEAVVADARTGLRRRGIDDVAVVAVRHRDGQVLALVGGHDFWSGNSGAQIPAFSVPRSPGSALKPVLYAQALDAGLVLPEQLVLDVPVDYAGYAPQNYSGEFDGMVPLQEALSRSLNVPFVRLLQQVGVESFLGQLRGLGVHSLSAVPGHYGLSAVVGGIELSPLELAGIYATLAEGGQARPLRWLEPGAPADHATAVMSPGAAWLTIRALSRRDRPDFPGRAALSAMPRHIHWKTGTSFGNRDAWAVGSGARVTVAVWLGNLDRRPAAALVGAQAAGPLLFDILDALDDGFDQDPVAAWTRPPDLRPVEVCALSGMLAGPDCPERREVLGLEARVPATRCTLHQRVEVDVDSGLVVGPGCREGRNTRQQVGVVWPAQVRRWLSARYRAEPAVRAVDPSCRLAPTGDGPRIVAPLSTQVVVLVPGVPAADQELPLEADAPAGAPLTWFVDGRELARVVAGDRAWWEPSPGTHELLVTDAHGRADSVAVQVRRPGELLATATSGTPPRATVSEAGSGPDDASPGPW